MTDNSDYQQVFDSDLSSVKNQDIMESIQCDICFETYAEKDNNLISPCNTCVFHVCLDCYQKLEKTTCPLCRTDIPELEIKLKYRCVNDETPVVLIYDDLIRPNDLMRQWTDQYRDPSINSVDDYINYLFPRINHGLFNNISENIDLTRRLQSNPLNLGFIDQTIDEYQNYDISRMEEVD